jgi:hypothetical protein
MGGTRTPRKEVNGAVDRDASTRARIEEHWEASERGDGDTEHAIYAADAILDYPQSGERFRGRSRIQAQRGRHPAERHFTVLRIRGGGDPVGKRVRDYLRRRADLFGEHHGVHRRGGQSRDPVVRRPLPGTRLAGGASRAHPGGRPMNRRGPARLVLSERSRGRPACSSDLHGGSVLGTDLPSSSGARWATKP